MAIPKMAVACRPDSAPVGPAISGLISNVIDSVEGHLGSIAIPTHLGVGVRFGFNSSNSSSPGIKVDSTCRIDLHSFELGSSGADQIHPTPAVHVEAKVWERGYDGTQTYLHGSPESSTRLRSVEMHLGWHNEDILDSLGNSTGQKESVWDASVVLNDAAFMGHMNWPDLPSSGPWDATALLAHASNVPGRLVIDGLSSATGALEVLGAFVQDYAQRQVEERFSSLLERLEELGLANHTGTDPTLPQWELDLNAIQTFLGDPLAYLQSFILDPYGQIDLSRPLPFGGRSVLDMLASILPSGRILNSPSNPLDGAALFEIPLPFSSGAANFHLTPNGMFGLATDAIGLGPMELTASVEMPLLDPASWISNGPVMAFTLHAADHVSGILGDCALVLARNSPWTLTLDLPYSGMVPAYDGSSFDWVQPPNQIVLSSSTGFDDLLTYVPGMIIDSALCTMVERILSPRVSKSGALSTILSELDLITWDSSGALSANSLFPLISNPIGHLTSCFTDAQGIDTSSCLNVAGALLGLLPADLRMYNDLDELIEHDVTGPVAQIVLPISILELSLQASPTSPGSLALILSTSSGLESSLSSSHIDLDASVVLNLHPDFTLDLDGTHVDIGVAFGAMISSLVANDDGSDLFWTNILSALSDAEANIHARLDSGIFHLEADVDFNPNDTSPAAHITLLPTVSGIDSFLMELVSSLSDALLPDIIEYVVNRLNTISVYTDSTSQIIYLSVILKDLLAELSLWDDLATPKVNLINFKNLCSNPVDYLKPRVVLLIAEALPHLQGIFPTTGSTDPVLKVTRVTSGTSDYRKVEVTATSAPAWVSDLSLNIGSKVSGGSTGLWLGYSTSIATGIILSGGAVANIIISVEAGALKDSVTDEWGMMASLSAHADGVLDDTLFTIQPSISFSLNDGNLSLLLSTMDDSSGGGHSPSMGTEAFWIRILPTADFDWGMPSLSNLLLGAANNALTFIEENTKVQDFLETSLFVYSGGSADRPPWADPLEDLTIIGEWLVHLGVCTYTGVESGAWSTGISKPPSPDYDIRLLQDIANHYRIVPLSQGGPTTPWTGAKNGLEILLRGAMSMISSVIPSSVSVYTKEDDEGNMALDISLSVEDVTDGKILGITVDFAPIEIEMGNLVLTLDFKDTSDPEYNGDWANLHKSYNPGITLQLVKWFTAPTADPILDDHLSLEFGHLSIHLGKADKKPMLDGFILLDAVAIITCLDFTFSGGFTTEAGGRLDIEGFGISLGGDGNTDGGNSLASGVLAGDEDGGEAVRPTFDLSVWKYDSNSLGIDMRGKAECWFPINKQFGPIKIAQIGVRIDDEQQYGGQDEPRIAILIDGEAEIAGFLAQVDDLEVSFPLLKITDIKGDNSNGWQYDMAGCAISYTGPAIEIAGALRKTLITDTSNNEYIEYQGLCTIKTSTMAISAIGAFGRVPVTGGDSYVTCFVIAALDMPIGGPPMFFVTGLLGGLGLNRELYVPDISQVPSSPFMLAMDGFGSDPMGALESIRTHLPAERGSLWFAIGVKFTTFQVIESKAVLYFKISNDDFAVGLIGLSAMSLPTPDLNIGYIELAFEAGYDSGTNIFRAGAQLTDASYLFSKSCRLTGGFALVNWFNRGDFLLSIGGYHPKFKVPSHYPAVPRLGFNWKPMSKLVIKGGAYFTVCSSAVMLGGSFEASYKSGCLSASFRAGVDVLIVFDPFFYSFHVYIGVSVRLKTWLGTLKASLGADLQIEGPKMRGTARIEVVFIEFTVKFGSNQKGSPQPISGKEFMNKHILQRPEGEFNDSFSNLFEKQFALAQPVKGLMRSGDGDSPSEDEIVNGPFDLEAEFEFAFSHLFPSESHVAYIETGQGHHNIDFNWRDEISVQGEDPFDIAPCHIDDDTNGAPFSIKILKENQPLSDVDYCMEGLSYVSTIGHFASTLWTCDMDGNNRPKASTSVPENQPRHLNGGSLIGCSTPFPQSWLGTIKMDQVEKSVFVHNLPLMRNDLISESDIIDATAIISKIKGATKVTLAIDSALGSRDDHSYSEITSDSGIKSYSMGMLATVLDGAKVNQEANRKALDAHSGVSIRTETIRTTRTASPVFQGRVMKR